MSVGEIMDVNVDHNIRVIVIARPCDGFRWQATFLLDRLNIEHIVCQDIYHAIAELQQKCHRHKSHVLVGAMQELCREDMRFLDLCQARKNTICCCLATGSLQHNLPKIIAAMETSALVVANIMDLEATIETLLKTPSNKWSLNPMSKTEDIKSLSHTDKDDITLTQAELDALLGTA